MTATAPAPAPASAPPADERVARAGFLARLLKRPDSGAFVGAVAVWVLFAITASSVNWATDLGIWSSWLNTAAYDGIVAPSFLAASGMVLSASPRNSRSSGGMQSGWAATLRSKT